MLQGNKIPLLNLARVALNSHANGPGCRDVVWVQGCSIGCIGCINRNLWPASPEKVIAVPRLLEKFASRVGQVEGITLSGGEPMEQPRGVAALLKGVKSLGLTTVVYTGFIYESLLGSPNPWVHEALAYTDLLLDGPFEKENQLEKGKWRGSANQRVISLSDVYPPAELKNFYHQPDYEISISVTGEKQEIFETGVRPFSPL